MTAFTRMCCYLLLSVAAVQAMGNAQAGSTDDLLPPPARQVEKRALGGEERGRRAYYDGRGGFGGAFSPDGKFLIASGGYQGMTLWDVGTGRALGQLPNPMNSQGISAAFTPNGKQFVAAGWGGGGGETCPVGLWDVAKRERLRSLDEDVNDTPLTALAMAPDGKTIALAGAPGRKNQNYSIHFWDIDSGDELSHIDGLVQVDPAQRNFGRGFEALAYSPDGRTLAILLQGRVLMLEVATAKQRAEITFATSQESAPERQGFMVGALAFAPDGRTLVVGCSDGAIRRFDLRTGREFTPLPGHTGGVVAVCCTPDGKSIHSYGIDGQFYVWRADSGRAWKPKAGPLADADVETLWDVLRSDDPSDLFGAVQTLAANPRQTTPFLAKRLAAVPKGDGERIEHLIEDIQKGDYNARKRAVVELRKIGAAAAPALQRSQEKGYDPLLRRLQFEFQNLTLTADQVRSVRALAVLERVGDADARKLLEELAAGSPEAALTIQAKAALDRLGKAEPPKADSTPEALWDALAAEDSTAAYRAVRAFANKPSAAALVGDRLKEVAAKDTFNDDPKRLAKLVADLDNDDFAVRDQATKDLRNLGRFILPALRKALDAKPGIEGKRRLEELVEDAAKASPPPEMLRVARALETLELMGGPESRQAIEALAKEARIKWLQEAASDSLRRQRPEKP